MCYSPNQIFINWTAFILYGIAYILAIAALSLDYLTKLTYDGITIFSTDSYVTYCGWQEMHEDQKSGDDQSDCYNDDDCGYKYYCKELNYDDACDQKNVGIAYLSIVIIGIILGLITIFGFIVRGRLWSSIGNILFGLCMFVAAGYYASEEKCTDFCDSLFLSYSSCKAEWGQSLALVITAGILSFFSAMIAGAYIR